MGCVTCKSRERYPPPRAGKGTTRGEQMSAARFALIAAVNNVVRELSASTGAAGTSSGSGTVTSGIAGADTAACLAHVIGGLSADSCEYYRSGCTGHDEPELDPVSTASRSAQNITW